MVLVALCIKTFKSNMVLVTLCIKTFKSLERRDLLSRKPAKMSVLQAIGDHAHLMVFNICLTYNGSNMFPHVENLFADCEQISYLCKPIKFYAFIRQFCTEKITPSNMSLNSEQMAE